MKFLSVRELRGGSSKVWSELQREGEMVVTSNGKPVAILSPVGEDNFERTISTLRQARAMMAVTGLQRDAHRNGTDSLSLDEINAEIDESRNRQRTSHQV